MILPVVSEPEAAADIDAALDGAPEELWREVEQAIEDVTRALRNSALQVGESRADGINRVFTSSPLTVHYQVVDRLSMVRVLAAQVYWRRS